MGCCISEPYKSIHISTFPNYYVLVLNPDPICCVNSVRSAYKLTDPFPNIQPIADIITIDLHLEQSSNTEIFLGNLSDWLANCSANQLKITAFSEIRHAEILLESFRFFRLQKLEITCLTNNSAEYIGSCAEVFREKYPELQIQVRIGSRDIRTWRTGYVLL